MEPCALVHRRRRQAASCTLAILALWTCASTRAAAPRSVPVAGVELRGLSPAQARARLAQALGPRLDTSIILTDGVRQVALTRRQLGIRLDLNGMLAAARSGRSPVPLRLTARTTPIRSALREVAPRFAFPGEKPRLIERAGRVEIVHGTCARWIDVPASAWRLAGAVREDPSVRVVRLLTVKSPRRGAEALEGIEGRLARYTTRFNPGSWKRAHNIRLAAKAVDGTVLRPGQVFSLNRTVGERTHARGYLTAPVIENGKVVPGIGGGVSQVTGTLFNAALLAGLQIVYYRTHARPARYVPMGRDATVAWGRFDMKFRNNTPAPVHISCKAAGSSLCVTLYGARPPGQRVLLTVASQRTGPSSINAKLYRTVKRRGQVIRKEMVGRSEYKWQPNRQQ